MFIDCERDDGALFDIFISFDLVKLGTRGNDVDIGSRRGDVFVPKRTDDRVSG